MTSMLPLAKNIWVANLWGITEGKGYAPLEWQLSLIKREVTRGAGDRLLSYNPERAVMAHGDIQREYGGAFLEQSFS